MVAGEKETEQNIGSSTPPQTPSKINSRVETSPIKTTSSSLTISSSNIQSFTKPANIIPIQEKN
ncbi:MAG: hypothetical protein HWD61_06695 [Parachlamydiaceae bacterium]|nr:MAG: hypothetical protein HWD61_06695 [Parachlamydiaceae bacterium]